MNASPDDRVDAHLSSLLSAATGEAAPPDDRLLGQVRDRLAEVPFSPDTSSPIRRHPILRLRIIRWFVPAAAALVAVIVLSNGSALTLADVQAAVGEKKWVHVKYDNGRERWISLGSGVRFYRHERGSADFHDRDRGIRQIYYGVEGLPNEIYEWSIEVKKVRQTPWESVLGHHERELARESRSDGVERDNETVGGRRLVRFDLYHAGVSGKRLLIKQIWADPRTRLPVRVRDRLHSGEQKKQGRVWISGEYDFPEAGPSDLYDVGVPRDAKIVKSVTTPLSDEVRAIVDAGGQARKAFPRRHRALIWPAERRGAARVVYRDGGKVWEMQYNIMPANDPKHKDAHLPLPAPAARLLAWTRTQVPVNLYFFDGTRTTYLRWRKFFEENSQPTVEIRRDITIATSDDPYRFQWPYLWSTNIQMLADAPDLPPGCIALRRETVSDRKDYYVDPAHDHICVRMVSSWKRSDKWEKHSGRVLSNFVRLPGGQWYATRRRPISYGGPKRETARYGQAELIDVKPLAENDYPPGVFDVEDLLKGAEVRDY